MVCPFDLEFAVDILTIDQPWVEHSCNPQCSSWTNRDPHMIQVMNLLAYEKLLRREEEFRSKDRSRFLNVTKTIILKRKVEWPRVLVCGPTEVGKSTLINGDLEREVVRLNLRSMVWCWRSTNANIDSRGTWRPLRSSQYFCPAQCTWSKLYLSRFTGLWEWRDCKFWKSAELHLEKQGEGHFPESTTLYLVCSPVKLNDVYAKTLIRNFALQVLLGIEHDEDTAYWRAVHATSLWWCACNSCAHQARQVAIRG